MFSCTRKLQGILNESNGHSVRAAHTLVHRSFELPGISNTRESRGEGEHPTLSSLKRSGCSIQFQLWVLWDALYQNP